ncbi:MAG: hypothetical protein R3F62_04465 [Planctomycetota bacterium]
MKEQTMINDREVVDALASSGDLAEVARVVTYEGIRTNKAGETHRVIVKCGEYMNLNNPDPSLRFYVEVTDEVGRVARGNPGPTPQEAIRFLHWEELDRPEH